MVVGHSQLTLRSKNMISFMAWRVVYCVGDREINRTSVDRHDF